VATPRRRWKRRSSGRDAALGADRSSRVSIAWLASPSASHGRHGRAGRRRAPPSAPRERAETARPVSLTSRFAARSASVASCAAGPSPAASRWRPAGCGSPRNRGTTFRPRPLRIAPRRIAWCRALRSTRQLLLSVRGAGGSRRRRGGSSRRASAPGFSHVAPAARAHGRARRLAHGGRGDRPPSGRLAPSVTALKPGGSSGRCGGQSQILDNEGAVEQRLHTGSRRHRHGRAQTRRRGRPRRATSGGGGKRRGGDGVDRLQVARRLGRGAAARIAPRVAPGVDDDILQVPAEGTSMACVKSSTAISSATVRARRRGPSRDAHHSSTPAWSRCRSRGRAGHVEPVLGLADRDSSAATACAARTRSPSPPRARGRGRRYGGRGRALAAEAGVLGHEARARPQLGQPAASISPPGRRGRGLGGVPGVAAASPLLLDLASSARRPISPAVSRRPASSRSRACPPRRPAGHRPAPRGRRRVGWRPRAPRRGWRARSRRGRCSSSPRWCRACRAARSSARAPGPTRAGGALPQPLLDVPARRQPRRGASPARRGALPAGPRGGQALGLGRVRRAPVPRRRRGSAVASWSRAMRVAP